MSTCQKPNAMGYVKDAIYRLWLRARGLWSVKVREEDDAMSLTDADVTCVLEREMRRPCVLCYWKVGWFYTTQNAYFLYKRRTCLVKDNRLNLPLCGNHWHCASSEAQAISRQLFCPWLRKSYIHIHKDSQSSIYWIRDICNHTCVATVLVLL